MHLEPKLAEESEKAAAHGLIGGLDQAAPGIDHREYPQFRLPAGDQVEHPVDLDGIDQARLKSLALGVEQAGLLGKGAFVPGDSDARGLHKGRLYEIARANSSSARRTKRAARLQGRARRAHTFEAYGDFRRCV